GQQDRGDDHGGPALKAVGDDVDDRVLDSEAVPDPKQPALGFGWAYARGFVEVVCRWFGDFAARLQQLRPEFANRGDDAVLVLLGEPDRRRQAERLGHDPR